MTQPTSTQQTLNGIELDTLHQTIAAVREQPQLGATTFHTSSHWVDSRRIATTVDGFASAGGEHERATPHQLLTDLPEPLGGTDAGPSPLELALSALGSCIAATLVVHAAAKGITLRSVNVAPSGDLDLRGFLNIAEVRTGFERVQLNIAIDGDLPEDELASFVDSALRFSPVLDIFRHGTAIETSTTAATGGDNS